MDPKKIMFVDLSARTAELRFMPEVVPFVGGVAMGIKLYSLYKEHDPIIISVGPLNGYFPFVSKTCFVLNNQGVIEDVYLGGSINFRIKYCGLDALVLAGASSSPVVLDIMNEETKFLDLPVDFGSLGLPGKRSILQMEGYNLLLDGYFGFDTGLVDNKFLQKKLSGIAITGTKIFEPNDFGKYSTLYKKVLECKGSVDVDFGVCPSCSGCPLGCIKSQTGETGGNILLHSLVACGYAENIYSNLGTVFACLDTLGYKYTHEDLEALPDLFTKTLKEIS